MLLPAWLRHCGTVSAGIEQVLTKKTGQEERTVEGMAKRRERDGSFIPFKSGQIPPRTTSRSSHGAKTGAGVHLHEFHRDGHRAMTHLLILSPQDN